MAVREPYTDEVRARFANPVHAGDLEGEYPEVLTAATGEAERGVWIIFSAGVDDGTIEEFRFRAWGCPHLIAAAELTCAEHEQGPVAALGDISANGLMARLSVPRDKTGKFLLLEDAIQALLGQHGGKA